MKKIIVRPVHGFNTDGEYIRKLETWFLAAGFDCEPFIYGKVAITTVGNIVVNRWRTHHIYNKLFQACQYDKHDKIILVGHSHGFRLSWGVQNVLADKILCVVGINGALNRDTKFKVPVVNLYHPNDLVLKYGARFRPLSKWGDYGARVNDGAMNINLLPYFDSWNPHSQFLDHLELVMPAMLRSIRHIINCGA